jgi:uncharacterized protein
MSSPQYAGRLRQLVLQPTSFCNIDCAYCYLPHRNRTAVMSADVLNAALRFARDTGLTGPSLDIRWHAGEPLAAPLRFYEDAFSTAAHILGGYTSVRHSVQTNAIMLDDAWAALLAGNAVQVGVSIDGPPQIHDTRRITRSGAGTFTRVMRGVAYLQKRGLAFDVIAVITPETLRHADAFMAFFAGLEGLRQLGLNVEESEGSHSSAAFASADFERGFRAFLRDLAAWSASTAIQVREFTAMRELVLTGARHTTRNAQNEAFAIVTVGTDGEIATFSPELLGLSHPTMPDGFVIGNVCTMPFDAILNSTRLQKIEADVALGVRLCRNQCPYFSLCGGGAPANKLYENGSFATTQTKHCSLVAMAVADRILEDMEREMLTVGTADSATRSSINWQDCPSPGLKRSAHRK